MLDASIVRSFVGEDVHMKYNMCPIWERRHTGCINLYLAFLVTFGFLSAANHPTCLPKNGTVADHEALTVPEANFVSDACYEGSNYENLNNINFDITVGLLVLEFGLHVYSCNRTAVVNTFRTFAKAEKKFSKLGEKDMGAEKLVQKLLDDPNATKLREILVLLWTHDPSKTIYNLMLREVLLFLTVGVYVGCVVLVFWVFHWEEAFFECTLNNSTSNVALNGEKVFNCSQPLNDQHEKIAYVYMFVVGAHAIARLHGLLAISYTLIKLDVTKRLKSAKSFALLSFMRKKTLTGEDATEFVDFVEMIFTKKHYENVMRHVNLVGTVNVDSALVNLVSTLRRRYAPGAAIRSNPDLMALTREKRWKWLVALLNQNKLAMNNLTDYRGLSDPDNNGNSILYYALRKKPEKYFIYRAAKEILKNVEQGEIFVWHDGVRMPARVFVNQQFLNDRTYPEQLKNYLIGLIETRQQQDELINLES